jgi:phospholipid/cholesterol/gamma-HCH transport system substrate-binding protein
MTITAPAPTATPPAPPRQGTRAKQRHYARWGALAVALALGSTVLVFASFGGTFSSYVQVTAQLPVSSTAVGLNSPVEYRNVTVGQVVSEGKSIPGGLVSVTLHMKPSTVLSIPADVRATVSPVSFFGNEYIVLVPPDHPGPQTLRAGQQIAALATGQTASLQALLGDLDHLLIELHPGQLDAALTALAGAVQGQGTSLGQNLVHGNSYLQGMLPLWPMVVADFRAFAPVAGSFAAATPDLLQLLGNQTVTSQTVTGSADAVRNAISGGATLAANAYQLFNAIQAPFAILTADSAPFLEDLSQSPNEIAQLLAGLDSFAKAFVAAQHGPYLSATATVNVKNPADLGVAVLGGSPSTLINAIAAGLGASFVNPPLYTAADCPHFGSLSNCNHVMTAMASRVLPAPAETQAITQIFQAETGRAPANASVSSLLLSPVLQVLITRS